MTGYWAEYDEIQIGPDARSGGQIDVERRDTEWAFTQILLDPRSDRSWRMVLRIDLDASRKAGAPRLNLISIEG
jgi:hypothetical protein